MFTLLVISAAHNDDVCAQLRKELTLMTSMNIQWEHTQLHTHSCCDCSIEKRPEGKRLVHRAAWPRAPAGGGEVGFYFHMLAMCSPESNGHRLRDVK